MRIKFAPARFFIFCLISMLFCLYCFSRGFCMFLSYPLLTLGGWRLDLPIIIDGPGIIFISVVFFISYNIFTFGKIYIAHEPTTNPRFWSLLTLFVRSIIALILVPNFISMIIGWDGLGISRFLLVIHYQNDRRLYAGVITIVSNRVGDALLLLTAGFLSSCGHWNIRLSMPVCPSVESIRLLNQIIDPDYLPISLLCMAAYTKRAQVPFNSWLPEAIAAPTPVSALVHSSTLVTAGVYVLIRSYYIWRVWPAALTAITLTGLATIVIGRRAAVTEGDVKKTVAYSTLSQLGYIVTIMGIGYPHLAFYHIIIHALFKATMFISVGAVFIYGHHYQSYDNWARKWYQPLVAVSLVVSLGCLNVAPFLAGAYSKELLIVTGISDLLNQPYPQIGLGVVLLAGTSLTLTYSVRIFRGLFTTKYTARAYITNEKPSRRPDIYAQDSRLRLRIPFLCMVLRCVIGGRIISWIYILPNDMIIYTWWFKCCTVAALFGGLLTAFLPCRNVTKGRVNILVSYGRIKRKRNHMHYHSKVPRYSKTVCNGLIIRGTANDFSHAANNGHWYFKDRAFYPFYRIYFLVTQVIHRLDQGFLVLWSTSRTKDIADYNRKYLRKLQNGDIRFFFGLALIIAIIVCLVI